MNTFNIITSVLAVLLLILFYRTFRNVSLKSLFLNAKNRAKIDVQREKAVKNGESPFYFRRGTVVIYAKTQARAIYDYKEFTRNEKSKKNAVRK